MREKILVTSALPYANGPIHLGHIAGAYLPADIFVRYHRMKGSDIIYICGSDEHGVPIAIKAEAENMTPQELVDKYHEMNRKSFARFGISFDNYSRTTLPIHYETSSDFFRKLHNDGVFKIKLETQLFCPNDNMFLPDRFVEGTCPNCQNPEARGDQCEKCGTWLDPAKLIEPHCKICGTTPRLENTKHWYMPLGRYQKQVEDWILSKKGWKENVVNYCKGWFAKGLEDRAVTRDLDWGVPVPLEEADGKVLYVWFDAVIGYISSTKEWALNRKNPDLWKEYWCDPDTKIYHFIGKDNIVFHAIFFPIMLMLYKGFTLPENVVANEFLNIEGRKISTSQNYAVWLDDYLKKFHPDPLRYCLASISPESRDADFSWKDFQARNNNELADILGNFINRTLVFIYNSFDARIPEAGVLASADEKLLKTVKKKMSLLANNLEASKVKSGIGNLMDIARLANKYFNDEEPWVTLKSDRQRCATTLYVCTQLIKNLMVGMTPFMPFTAENVAKTLSMHDELLHSTWDELLSGDIAAGMHIDKPEILFSKIDDDVIQYEIDKLNAVVTGCGADRLPGTVGKQQRR
ncbi:methionine--tRNA ligase, partial [candidate division KSB1 bacterium]